MKMLHGLMASAALVAMPVSAFGQDTAQEQDEEQAGVATDDASVGYGDAIVVSATRRNQIAQDVPIAVTVVGGEQLENAGVVDVRGIRQVTPSLQATTGQSSATGVVLSIRGIGTAGDNPGFEPAVGVFVDGVFRARAGLALAELPPIERVEVLRGPQGTLFGRNTSAGALSIITKGPAFTFGGYGEATYGNYDELEVKAGVTGPVSDAFALRLDGGYHRRDGYIHDVNSDRSINNLDRYFVRGQGLFENDALTFRLIGDYAETDENCCGALNTNSGFILNAANFVGTSNFSSVAIANAAAGVINAFSGLAGNVGIVRPFDAKGRQMAITPGREYTEKVREWGISGELNYDFDGINFTSITAYRDWKALRDQDIDFSGLDRAYRDDYRTTLKDFTQEIRLQGSAFDDKLNWLIGGFYLNETLTLRDTVRFGAQADQYVDGLFNAFTRGVIPTGFQLYGTLGPAVPYFAGIPLPRTPNGAGQVADDYTVDTDAYAIFTHNIINFTDQLSLTLGVRYNHESKKINADLNSIVPACNFFLNPASGPYRQALAANGLGAFILLACNPTVNTEFNGTYNGKRSENEFTGTAKLAYKITPDIMLYGGYDRGFKSGGYNLDRGTFDTRLLGGNGPQIEDLEFGNETVDAYEIGLKTQFSRAFTFNITGFYQDFAGYQSLRFEGTNFVVRQFNEVISQGVELEALIRPVSEFMVQLGYTYLDAKIHDPLAPDDGQQLTNQPHHVVTGALTWTPQLSDNVGGLVHVDFRQNSDANVINDPIGVPFTTNDGYGIWNARVGLNFADNRFGVEAYVENIFDTYYNVTGFPIPEQGASFAVYPSPPRFYGVKVRARF